VALRPHLSAGLPLTVADTMQKRPYEDQASPSTNATRKSPNEGRSASLVALSAGFGPEIAALESKAKAALGLLNMVRKALPEAEKNHVLSASYQEETLVVTTDSAAWSTHLRYRENSLREQLIALGEKPFTVLKVRVGRP
jgi:hypothetical protein